MLNVKIEELKDFLEKSKDYIKVISFYVDKGGNQLTLLTLQDIVQMS